MNLLRKRSVAIILSVLIVFCSTLISIGEKLEAKCGDVSAIFFDGVRISGVEYPAMAPAVKELCNVADDVILIAENYGIDTAAMAENLEYLELAVQYSSDEVQYIGSCYSDFLNELKAVLNLLDSAGLSQRHTTLMAEYNTVISDCMETVEQGAAGYNEAVRSFLRSYDKFPSAMWAEMTGTWFPGYFYS